MSQSDANRKKSVVEHLDEMAINDEVERFNNAIVVANQELERPKLPSAVEDAIKVPDVRLEDAFMGVLKRAADLTEDLGNANKQNLNLEASNASYAANSWNVVEESFRLFFSLGAHEKRFDENVAKFDKRDWARGVGKYLPYVLVTIVAIVAIIYLSSPQLLIPFGKWLQPSSADCRNEVVQNNPAANQSAILQLTNQCAANISYEGDAHIAIVIIPIVCLSLVGVLVLRSRRRKKNQP